MMKGKLGSQEPAENRSYDMNPKEHLLWVPAHSPQCNDKQARMVY